jgi:hypothetical protein
LGLVFDDLGAIAVDDPSPLATLYRFIQPLRERTIDVNQLLSGELGALEWKALHSASNANRERHIIGAINRLKKFER